MPVGGVTQYKTQYGNDTNTPDNDKTITDGYDFDRDGTADEILAGHLKTDPAAPPEDPDRKVFVAGAPVELQGVWLSSGGLTSATGQPDITRVMDSNSFLDVQHQGLLSEISIDDLSNTDLYIVRMSDGKLIAERIGLNKLDTLRGKGVDNSVGADSDNSRFFYSIQMQGNKNFDLYASSINQYFSDWQSGSGINPELHQREADHLQPGDALRLYAINRATGYIGHVDTTMQSSLKNGRIDFPIDPIIMGPPNLKIRAERGYKIEKGITASKDTITQLIGFEGASLTSDNTVEITTEWLDHEGRPIPESLAGAGYTGRIAILSGDQTLPNDNQGVFSFTIDPGRRLQVLQLPNALTDSQHFYIHVSGEPKSGNPGFGGDPIFGDSTDNVREKTADFKSSGQNPGILAKRPDNYVPFLVPLYDEVNSELQTQVYRKLKADNPGITYETPGPIYRWVYRPEMQFTSYDLTVTAINKSRDADGSGTIESTETINVLNDETPLIPSNTIVDILYGLSTTELLPLDYFNAGASKELIFVIGEQEIVATLGADQKLTFENLNFLELLSPDDFLSIRLYANNDMGNTLWEWAWVGLDLDIDSDNNNNFGEPDMTPEEDEIEQRIDDPENPGKIIITELHDSDKQDDDELPDFADYIIVTEANHKTSFTPIVIDLGLPEDELMQAKLLFNYFASNPGKITRYGNKATGYQYMPESGMLRIWTKPAAKSRNSASVIDGGDWVLANTPVPLSKLPALSDGKLVLYVENVGLSQKTGDHIIKTSLIKNN